MSSSESPNSEVPNSEISKSEIPHRLKFSQPSNDLCFVFFSPHTLLSNQTSKAPLVILERFFKLGLNYFTKIEQDIPFEVSFNCINNSNQLVNHNSDKDFPKEDSNLAVDISFPIHFVYLFIFFSLFAFFGHRC